MVNTIINRSAHRHLLAVFVYVSIAFLNPFSLANLPENGSTGSPSDSTRASTELSRMSSLQARAESRERTDDVVKGKVIYQSMEIFPLVKQHIHAPTIVELSDGSLLTAWYQGSGERSADDVAIMGARLKPGQDRWTKPFVIADVPDFPDINPILFIDPRERLWLIWYTVIANQWETSLLKFRISDNYMMKDGPPEWSWQDVLLMKPGDSTERGIQPDDSFVKSVERQVEEYAKYLWESAPADNKGTAGLMAAGWRVWAKNLLSKARGEDMMRDGYLIDSQGKSTKQLMGYPYFRRMGWQTRNKPFIVDKKRIIVPLYSDGFSFSLMAITDDFAKSWQFSEPLVGPGNIQPAIVQKADGTLVAYMRDNGPPPKRLQVSSSTDKGLTWSPVRDSDLPNPGSGADAVTLQNGNWALVYNDTEDGRHSLAVSISTDEGKTWKWTRHLEKDTRPKDSATRSHYPAIVQGRDGSLYVVYAYHHNDRKDGPSKTIKYVHFNEVWVRQGQKQ